MTDHMTAKYKVAIIAGVSPVTVESGVKLQNAPKNRPVPYTCV